MYYQLYFKRKEKKKITKKKKKKREYVGIPCFTTLRAQCQELKRHWYIWLPWACTKTFWMGLLLKSCWLGFQASTAAGIGSIRGQWTKILTSQGLAKKKKREREMKLRKVRKVRLCGAWKSQWEIWSNKKTIQGSSVGLVATTPHSQCRQPRFNPWSGN